MFYILVAINESIKHSLKTSKFRGLQASTALQVVRVILSSDMFSRISHFVKLVVCGECHEMM